MYVSGVKNISMPKNCFECNPQIGLWCMLTHHVSINVYKRPSNCPIALAKKEESYEDIR